MHIYIYIYMCVCVCVCVCLSIYPSTYLSTCLSSIYILIYLLYLSIYLFTILFPSCNPILKWRFIWRKHSSECVEASLERRPLTCTCLRHPTGEGHGNLADSRVGLRTLPFPCRIPPRFQTTLLSTNPATIV